MNDTPLTDATSNAVESTDARDDAQESYARGRDLLGRLYLASQQQKK